MELESPPTTNPPQEEPTPGELAARNQRRWNWIATIAVAICAWKAQAQGLWWEEIETLGAIGIVYLCFVFNDLMSDFSGTWIASSHSFYSAESGMYRQWCGWGLGILAVVFLLG